VLSDHLAVLTSPGDRLAPPRTTPADPSIPAPAAPRDPAPVPPAEPALHALHAPRDASAEPVTDESPVPFPAGVEEPKGCLYALSQPPLMLFLCVIGGWDRA
jgi:hypothetical protein